jgi:hypothetical protein
MGSVTVIEELPVDADRAWKLVREFDNLALYEGVVDELVLHDADGRIERTVRIGGVTLRQRLESRDDAARELRIHTIDGGGILQRLEARLSVTESGTDSCVMMWEAEYEPMIDDRQMKPLIRDFYLTAIALFRRHLGDQPGESQ